MSAEAGFNWDIFCTVVDNFGDAGVCWRLARQLAAEHGLQVRLWIDDLTALARLEPSLDAARESQQCRGVQVRCWANPFADAAPADVVIEAFACELPARYVEAMARREPEPCWINLEYLSAESWVAGCHGRPSPHPRLPLTRYFFFPGFGPDSGGLLREAGLEAERSAFRADAVAQASFWRDLGLPPTAAGELRISLFSYDNAAIPALLAAWEHGDCSVVCAVPQSVALAHVGEFFGRPAVMAGETLQRGNLTVKALPFVEQDRYDRLLWACDVNFVRGEDSFVRAQWARRPLVWQIYPQAQDAHLAKLDAFLAIYCADMPAPVSAAVKALWLTWNAAAHPQALATAWPAVRQYRGLLEAHARRWAASAAAVPDLATNLVQFCRNRLK
jgi:uncharacterized repeat protein (TIGR03837 family)